MNLNQKVQAILKKRNKEINSLIARAKSIDYGNPEIINQFYQDLIYNLQIIDFLILLDDFERGSLLTESLFEVHYSNQYGGKCEEYEDLNNNQKWNIGEFFIDKNENNKWDCYSTDIPGFIKAIKSKVEINLDRTMSEKNTKIAINEFIIEEIYNFSIEYDDDYVQNFIAMLRDALVQKYK